MIEVPAVKNPGVPRILVAPLDWGLGHATRCMPVIYELIRQGCEVWLAGEGAQENLLKKEFPDLPILPLKGYRVRYGNSRLGLLKAIFFQLPEIVKVIRHEHNWLKKAVIQFNFDAVIADNRFGLYHSAVPSVFITHQLMIKTPFGKWSEQLLQKINYKYINRFTECWIPDDENENGFAGELSHPVAMPAIPGYYTGILSRLKNKNIAEEKNHLLISLSGPEPQRTLLENKIIEQLGSYKGSVTIVRGLPGGSSIIPSINDTRFYNHLGADEYNIEIAKASYVISRSGYSTVMDIIMLGKKSILIPTPGQPEQEYLARYLCKKQLAFSQTQKDFSLMDTLQKANAFDYKINEPGKTLLEQRISSLIRSLPLDNQKTKTPSRHL